MVGLHLLSSLPDTLQNMITYSPIKVPDSHTDRRNLTFQLHDGSKCTILVSKKEKKIKMYSDHLYHQNLILRELLSSVGLMDQMAELYDIITFEDKLPTSELFELLDLHFKLRKNANDLRKQLEKRTV